MTMTTTTRMTTTMIDRQEACRTCGSTERYAPAKGRTLGPCKACTKRIRSLPKSKELDRIRKRDPKVKARLHARMKTSEWKFRNWESHLKRSYGITVTDHETMLHLQFYSCKICGIQLDRYSARVDHCHETKIVRGLLCNRCNLAIGLLKHSTVIMQSAIRYFDEQRDNGHNL